MRVAVTGGSGFIGTYVMTELLAQGHTPVSIDRHLGLDLFSEEAGAILEESDHVIHLAGILGTSELFDSVPSAVNMNVQGTVRVLEICQKVNAGYVGITMPQVGWKNVYQATKKCAQELAEAYAVNLGLYVSHVRAFNAFGPGQKVGSPQKIIPTFADCAWRGEPLPIWGDGKQLVDLVHAADVAKMLVGAMSFGECQVFDAGSGLGYSVDTIAQYVIDYTGSSSEKKYLPMRKGELATLNPLYARGEGWDELGWRPGFQLRDLDDTIDSYKP